LLRLAAARVHFQIAIADALAIQPLDIAIRRPASTRCSTKHPITHIRCRPGKHLCLSAIPYRAELIYSVYSYIFRLTTYISLFIVPRWVYAGKFPHNDEGAQNESTG
jgi:hypothetical protein